MPTCGHGHVVEILATKEYSRRVTRCLNAINDYANKLLAVYTQLGGLNSSELFLLVFHQKFLNIVPSCNIIIIQRLSVSFLRNQVFCVDIKIKDFSHFRNVNEISSSFRCVSCNYERNTYNLWWKGRTITFSRKHLSFATCFNIRWNIQMGPVIRLFKWPISKLCVLIRLTIIATRSVSPDTKHSMHF